MYSWYAFVRFLGIRMTILLAPLTNIPFSQPYFPYQPDIAVTNRHSCLKFDPTARIQLLIQRRHYGSQRWPIRGGEGYLIRDPSASRSPVVAQNCQPWAEKTDAITRRGPARNTYSALSQALAPSDSNDTALVCESTDPCRLQWLGCGARSTIYEAS